MQMKVEHKPQPRPKAHKFSQKKMRELLTNENEDILNLMAMCDVPNSFEDESFHEQFLLDSKKSVSVPAKTGSNRAKSAEALQDRLEIMKNKMNSKKSKPSERTIKKRQLKKLKKDGELKKRVISVAKSLKNEKSKEEKLYTNVKDEEDSKADAKPKVYNEEGKMVFSKFEFAAQASKAKKGKKDKVIKNPKLLLQKIKNQNKTISALEEQGEGDKAAAIKQDLAWKKAFDKTAGKQIKDNTTLLTKSIKRQKVIKKKSKKDWKDRAEKVQKDIAGRQKKRTENIKKKSEEKKKNKLKKLSKRGRIIPGY